MDSFNPIISMIVSMYSGEKYIKECIESIVKQDYTNLEVILVDDGSPDNCGKIADEYAEKDARIQVIHQENTGVSVARNAGLEKATGEYVCIIDQDDIISENYVSYFYSLIRENNAQISLTPTADKFFESPQKDTSDDSVQVWTGEKTAIEMLYHKIIIGPWNKMISRKLLVNNGVKFNPELFGGEGFAFSVQSYQYADKVAVGKRKVYHYRVGDPESGASKFRISSIESSIKAQKYIRNTFVRETKELLRAWEFSNWHTYCDCFNMMVGCGATEESIGLYQKMKKVCQKEALRALKAPVSLQQKSRGILFGINPYMAAKVINHFRKRKFANKYE